MKPIVVDSKDVRYTLLSADSSSSQLLEEGLALYERVLPEEEREEVQTLRGWFDRSSCPHDGVLRLQNPEIPGSIRSYAVVARHDAVGTVGFLWIENFYGSGLGYACYGVANRVLKDGIVQKVAQTGGDTGEWTMLMRLVDASVPQFIKDNEELIALEKESLDDGRLACTTSWIVECDRPCDDASLLSFGLTGQEVRRRRARIKLYELYGRRGAAQGSDFFHKISGSYVQPNLESVPKPSGVKELREWFLGSVPLELFSAQSADLSKRFGAFGRTLTDEEMTRRFLVEEFNYLPEPILQEYVRISTDASLTTLDMEEIVSTIDFAALIKCL